jgi:uncharacterized coiled-coil protein SlyX
VADPASSSPQVLHFPKTIELEQRLARLELTVSELRLASATDASTIKDLRATVEMLRTRIVSLQAQLDYMSAKVSPY